VDQGKGPRRYNVQPAPVAEARHNCKNDRARCRYERQRASRLAPEWSRSGVLFTTGFRTRFRRLSSRAAKTYRRSDVSVAALLALLFPLC